MEAEKPKRKSPDDFFKSLERYVDFVYHVYNTSTFKRNVKLCYKRNLDLELLEEIIVKLARKVELNENNRPHPLKGFRRKQFEEVMECHIMPDWLPVWTQNDTDLILLFTNTGSHADLFG